MCLELRIIICINVDECDKLEKMGIGVVITKEQMDMDKVVPKNRSALVYLKPEYGYLDYSLFDMANDVELRDAAYLDNYKKEYNDVEKAIIRKYHPHYDEVMHSQIDNSQYSNHGEMTRRRMRAGYPKKCLVTALDSMEIDIPGIFFFFFLFAFVFIVKNFVMLCYVCVYMELICRW